MAKTIKFELTNFQGEPAIMFEDGDIVLQKETLGEFLRLEALRLEPILGKDIDKLEIGEG